MSAYYHCLDRSHQADGSCIAHYQPTLNAQGTWNLDDQHMASAAGLLTRELEHFAPEQHMRIARISFDILGRIPLADTTITTRFVRAGRTIALLEAVLSVQGRDCIVARAWRLLTQDTSAIVGIEDSKSEFAPSDLPEWDEMHRWPGGFIKTLKLYSVTGRRAGRGMAWVTTDVEMVAGEPTSDLTALMGMVDTANGIVPRLGLGLDDADWMFPNTDLQVHLFRAPIGRDLGIEAVQQFGDDGIGLTSAILHDINGPFGRSEQILTVRPMPK